MTYRVVYGRYAEPAPVADVVMHINRLRKAGGYHRDLVASPLLRRFLPVAWDEKDAVIAKRLQDAQLDTHRRMYLIQSCQDEVHRCRARRP